MLFFIVCRNDVMTEKQAKPELRGTSARVLDLVRVKKLHQDFKGLGLGLPDGHFQQRLRA